MNITRHNFNLVRKGIVEILKDCDFIAFDLEMTGITIDKSIVNTKHESINFRYLKLQHSIKRFCPLQVGVCGINLKQGIYHPFTFHVVPSKETAFSFDIGSIQFLASHSFDFNKVFYEGIPYNRTTESEAKANKFEIIDDIARPEIQIFMMSVKDDILRFIEETKGKPYDDPSNLFKIEVLHVKKASIKFLVSNIRKYIPTDVFLEVELSVASDFTQELIFKVSSEERINTRMTKTISNKDLNLLSNWIYYQNKYFNSCKGKKQGDTDIQANVWKRLIVQTTIANLNKFDAHFNSQSLNRQLELLDIEGFNEEKIFQLLKIVVSSGPQNEDSDNIYQDLKQMMIDFNVLDSKKINFSEILKPLTHIPFVFHNGSLDLMHMIDKFYAELPSDYRDFARMVRANIKTIYDTKFIAENSLFLKSQFKFNTGLENISSILEIGAEGMTQHIDITKSMLAGKEKSSQSLIEEAIYDEINDKMLNHNAGYDSYATAKTFVYEIKSLFNLNINSRDQAEQYLQPFKNKLLVSGSNLVIDFEEQISSNDETSELFLVEGLVESVSSSLFKVNVKQGLGINNFSYTTIYGTNSVIISLTSRKEINSVNEAIAIAQGSLEFKVESSTCRIIKYSDYKENQSAKLNSIISDELI